MKRFLAVFLVLCAVLAGTGGLGNPAKADIDWTITKGVGYVCEDRRHTAIVYDYYPENLRKKTEFRESVTYNGEIYRVTTIADGAFLGCKDVTGVSVPDSVTSIGEYAFYQCDNLARVSFGDGSRLAGIGEYAFKDCTGLKEIGIPATVSYYGNYAFDGCNAVTVTFYSQDFTLPANFLPGFLLAYRRIIQTNDGHGTAKLKVSVSDGTAEVIPVPDKGYETDRITITRNDGRAISNPFPAASEGDLVIHTTFKRSQSGTSENTPTPAPTPDPAIVTEGGLRYRLDLGNDTALVLGTVNYLAKKIEIPSKVTIGNHTFTVTAIEAKAFMGMQKLKEVILGRNVASIGEKAFYKCVNLKVLTIKTKHLAAETVGAKAFGRTYEKIKVTVPKGMKTEYKKILEKKGLSKKAKYQ